MGVKDSLNENDRPDAALLYAHAVKRQFGRLLGDEDTAAARLERGPDPKFSLIDYRQNHWWRSQASTPGGTRWRS